MSKKRLLILYIFVIFDLFVMSCSDELDEIKLLVLCDGPFKGTYILNSETPVGFGGSSDENPYVQTGNSYYFQKTFDDLDSIDVDATRELCSDSLKIKIYRDDTKVKEAYLDADSDDDCSDLTLNLTYEYDEESEDDDDDDDE